MRPHLGGSAGVALPRREGRDLEPGDASDPDPPAWPAWCPAASSGLGFTGYEATPSVRADGWNLSAVAPPEGGAEGTSEEAAGDGGGDNV
jgi:hypothetical protein